MDADSSGMIDGGPSLPSTATQPASGTTSVSSAETYNILVQPSSTLSILHCFLSRFHDIVPSQFGIWYCGLPHWIAVWNQSPFAFFSPQSSTNKASVWPLNSLPKFSRYSPRRNSSVALGQCSATVTTSAMHQLPSTCNLRGGNTPASTATFKAVLPCLSCSSLFAPDATKSSATSAAPMCAATCNGVIKSWFGRSMSASFSNRKRVTAADIKKDASCKGQKCAWSPRLASSLGSPRNSTRVWSTSTSPLCAARCMGSTTACLSKDMYVAGACTSAMDCSRSLAMSAASEHCTATCKAVPKHLRFLYMNSNWIAPPTKSSSVHRSFESVSPSRHFRISSTCSCNVPFLVTAFTPLRVVCSHFRESQLSSF
mmetsp:Transcript_162197/g.520176  ORF Transcript_162197/g.520176 Transcript_162197/m.520176 type:complete len:370 (-) Transcript_162197:172-1281(-)